MRDIYERLNELGFRQKFVKSCILPDWWEDNLAEIPANRQYAEAVISRQLGIAMADIRDYCKPLKIRQSDRLKMKRRQGATHDDMKVATLLGERVAKIAAGTLDTPPNLSDLTASSIRQKILDSGAKWVGFHELLDFCWSIGIPVVHLCKMPEGSKKPDAMAVWTEERPVIVISSGRKHPAWHIFYIAHELGHIACGHLSKGELNLDPKIELDPEKKQETEANAFAIELLTGYSDFSFGPPFRRMRSAELATFAKSIGKKYKIDPGFLILSYSRSKEYFALASAALNALNPNANVCQLYQSPYQQLRMDDTTEDSRHVFERLTEAA